MHLCSVIASYSVALLLIITINNSQCALLLEGGYSSSSASSPPRFVVYNPDEFKVLIPGAKTITNFNLQALHEDNSADILQSQYIVNDYYIRAYGNKFNLVKGSDINYTIGYLDEAGHQSISGQYIFDGVYQRRYSRPRRRSPFYDPAQETHNDDTGLLSSRFGNFDYYPRHHSQMSHSFGRRPDFQEIGFNSHQFLSPWRHRNRGHHGHHGHRGHHRHDCNDDDSSEENENRRYTTTTRPFDSRTTHAEHSTTTTTIRSIFRSTTMSRPNLFTNILSSENDSSDEENRDRRLSTSRPVDASTSRVSTTDIESSTSTTSRNVFGSTPSELDLGTDGPSPSPSTSINGLFTTREVFSGTTTTDRPAIDIRFAKIEEDELTTVK